ncbi:hypothetical protein F4818DRAFT_385628 [Hypoxylon cercidicola]|nr:hypothetical protein F4818DRAFT_385628 [Hypoxylon cercidicola]
MEPKLEEKQTAEDQAKLRTSSQTERLPTSGQETREDTNVLMIHRPWTNRLLALGGYLQKEDWRKTEDRNGDRNGETVERWSVQSMTNEPYNTIKSVIGQTQDDQTKLFSGQSPQSKVAPSETVATAGSR